MEHRILRRYVFWGQLYKDIENAISAGSKTKYMNCYKYKNKESGVKVELHTLANLSFVKFIPAVFLGALFCAQNFPEVTIDELRQETVSSSKWLEITDLTNDEFLNLLQNAQNSLLFVSKKTKNNHVRSISTRMLPGNLTEDAKLISFSGVVKQLDILIE